MYSAQLLEAAGPKGVVIGWGENLHGESTGVPWPGLFAVPLIITNAVLGTGVVTIANQELTNATGIAASQCWALALKSDGTVAGWGGNLKGTAVGYETPYPGVASGLVTIRGEVLSNVVSIAAGRLFGLALKADGTVVIWGENTIPFGLSNVVAISARGIFCLAVKNDGTVAEWTSNGRGDRHFPSDLTNIVAAAAGGTYWERCLALTRDGNVVAWGNESDNHDMRPPADLTNVVSIAVGQGHSLAVKRDGTVVGWGGNGAGQATGVPTKTMPWLSHGLVTLGGHTLSNVVAVAAGNDYNLALLNNGTVTAWGNPESYYPVPSGLTNVVAIAAGERFCLAISTNATLLKISGSSN